VPKLGAITSDVILEGSWKVPHSSKCTHFNQVNHHYQQCLTTASRLLTSRGYFTSLPSEHAIWRRDLTAELLQQFELKLIRDDAELERLRKQRRDLEEKLADQFETLVVTKKKVKEARASLGDAKTDLEKAQDSAKEKLDELIAAREKDKEAQVTAMEESQEKYEVRLAAYENQVHEMRAQNFKLRQISTYAVKYITESNNSFAFFGYLASKGIVMEFAVFMSTMKAWREMTADELLLSMGDDFLSLLQDIDLPNGKADEVPPIPEPDVVFPDPFFVVSKASAKDV